MLRLVDVALRLRDGSVIQMHHPAGKGWKPLLFRDRADEARMLVERVEACRGVVEDPAAVTTARAGAAIALRNGLDDHGRVLADACAAPRPSRRRATGIVTLAQTIFGMLSTWNDCVDAA
jgi:hypothetical protein